MSMEFRPSLLLGPDEESPQPEGMEAEQDPLKEKVDAWAQEYIETHQKKDLGPNVLSPEVEEWFTDYEARRAAIHTPNLSEEEFIEQQNQLDMEYTEKIQQPEYMLFELRKDKELNKNRIPKYEHRIRAANEERSWEERKDKIPPRDLLDHFKETANAIADMEGPDWVNNQLQEGFSLLGALKYLEEHKDDDPKDVIYEIYGDKGMNRWFVTGDGKVFFSKENGKYSGGKALRRGFEMR